jgi:hypothetical protein
MSMNKSRASHSSMSMSRSIIDSGISVRSSVDGGHTTLMHQRSLISSSKYTLSGSKNKKHTTVPGTVSEYVWSKSESKSGTRGVEMTKSRSGLVKATETDPVRVGISEGTFVEQGGGEC